MEKILVLGNIIHFISLHERVYGHVLREMLGLSGMPAIQVGMVEVIVAMVNGLQF